MPDPLLDLPLEQIDAEALPRDRTHLDDAALEELITSIAATTLRQPIEVWALSTPRPPCLYGLISGHRRLTAVRTLQERWELPRFATIPAFIRTPASVPAVLTAMVEENDIRTDISPWERGLICVATRDQGYFPTIDAAIDALYPSAARTRRTRLRALALLAEELQGHLTAPETLTQNQALRLSAALRGGFSDLIRHALAAAHAKSGPEQWALLQPILLEAEDSLRDPTPYAPGRPRRLIRPRDDLAVRRERAPEGWVLRFTGPEATGMLMESLMDEIERWVGK